MRIRVQSQCKGFVTGYLYGYSQDYDQDSGKVLELTSSIYGNDKAFKDKMKGFVFELNFFRKVIE